MNKSIITLIDSFVPPTYSDLINMPSASGLTPMMMLFHGKIKLVDFKKYKSFIMDGYEYEPFERFSPSWCERENFKNESKKQTSIISIFSDAFSKFQWNILYQDNDGKTAIDWAKSCGNSSAVNLLYQVCVQKIEIPL